MKKLRPISLIVLLFVLASISSGYSQNGAVFSPLQPVIIKGSNGGYPVEVNADGQMHVVMRGAIDGGNSTETPLASGAQFVGNATDILDYGIIFIAAFSDVPSASDGLSLQQSCDGVNWDVTDEYTIASSSGKTFSIQPACQYFRVAYTNGGLPQGVFRLHTVLKKMNSKPSSHRISDMIIDDDDAELMKSVVSAQDETGAFVNVRAVQGDTGNNLKVSLDQIEPTTNSVQVIAYAHGELHEGKHYQVRNTALLAKAGTKDILIVTPDTARWAHMVIGLETNDAAVTGYLFEAPTITASGTLDGARNRNRNYADNNTTLIYENPTVTAAGTLLAKYTIGSGKNSGGGARDNEEFVLKQNTPYLFRATEGNVSATNINWTFDWYEHTNKN